jgi:hypothetical protein
MSVGVGVGMWLLDLGKTHQVRAKLCRILCTLNIGRDR